MLRPNDQPVLYLTGFGGGVNPNVEAGERRNLDVSSAIDAARGVGDKPSIGVGRPRPILQDRREAFRGRSPILDAGAADAQGETD
jgi:hypothetical protein